MPVRLGAALIAEFVGTFALCCVGILGIHWSGGALLPVALAHGLILATMVSATMPTSGGHLNPSITFGFLITGKIKPKAALAYIGIQLLASVVASFLVFGMFQNGAAVVREGTPQLGPGVSGWMGTLVEIVATFLLGFSIWGTAADPRARNVGGFAIGLTIAADILAFGNLTGASMNPARSFGPTFVAAVTDSATIWKSHWVYWLGPLAGASLAALVYHLVLWPRDPRRGIDAAAQDVPPSQRP